ncbi:unnamed protein product [Staurois parvus]|uniref:Uncharacterized protein n=1 Tax=Staurois parvus TaxID=386267 RepID=A0ABN9F8E0_9NEOB|nr:unnamed protein product [Staurois parvus]
MTAGTGSPGIRSFGSTAGTGSGTGSSGSTAGIESTGLIGSEASGCIQASG